MRDRIVIVDILAKKFKSVLYKQYDDNNELNIVVYKGKTLVNISKYIAYVYFELPSGKVYEVEGTIENNAIKVMLSSSILEEYGQVNVECEILNLDKVVTTFTFYLNVEKSIDKIGALAPNTQPQQIHHKHSNLDVLNQITQEMIDNIDSSGESVDLSNYQTKKDTTLETDEKTVIGAINELNEKIENISVNVDLSDYALKSEIPIVPTNVSELNNDSGYLTEVPSEYITETELANKGFATESFVTNKISESQLSDEQAQQLNDAYIHSQSTHVQQSDIPTKTSQLTNDSDFATNSSVDEKIANANTGGTVDLTSYAKKTDLPTKTSQLTNDSGFITEHQDISNKADKSEIPTKTSQLANDNNFISSIPSEYITETELESKGYLTEHQSLDNYALKSEIPTVPTKISQLQNDSNFISSIPKEYVTEQELNNKGLATETFVTNKIAEAQLGGGSSDIDLSKYVTKDYVDYQIENHTHPKVTNEDIEQIMNNIF